MDNALLGDVGKIIAGALVVGSGAWGVLKVFMKDRRDGTVADAEAKADVGAFSAYSGTISMLQAQVDRMRAEHETAAVKWRADMDALDTRLKTMSDQIDAAITRARTAEAVADRLRAQLRSANLEPVA
jgi:hypothetical protein